MFTLKKVQRACCGRSASVTTITRNDAFAKSNITIEVAPEGSTLLIYAGSRVGSFSVWGFATGTMYRVKPGVPFAASNLDLRSTNAAKNPGLLDRYNADNTYMFNIFDPTPIKEEEVPVKESITEEPKAEEVVKEITLPTVDTSVLDGNITQFNIALDENNYSSEDLTVLLAYEQTNKNRVTVISALENLINEASS